VTYRNLYWIENLTRPANWFGVHGLTPFFCSAGTAPGVETVIHKFDLEPDGVWLNEMKMSGGSNFQKIIFKEVSKPEKLVWHHCSADADWNIAANPMMPDWPRILLTTVTFEEKGDQTNVRLSQIPLDATDAEIACFAKMKDGMSGGWGSGYAIIDELLAELQAG